MTGSDSADDSADNLKLVPCGRGTTKSRNEEMRNGNEEIRNGNEEMSLTRQQFWHDLTVLLAILLASRFIIY